MLNIDGAMGEGGGQIIRSSLALSLLTGKPFRIENIRAGRKKPGLLRQHLTAVKAAKLIGKAEVEGAELRSGALTFAPTTIEPGDYHFAVGTAGSATLVFQTVLPALMMASGPSTLTLEGGTHNPYAPPFEYIERVFLPLVNRMGPSIEVKLERPGFYPAGGGRFTATVTPASGELRPLALLERGEITGREARALFSHLPQSIAHREASTLADLLNWERATIAVEEDNSSIGPGNVVSVLLSSEYVSELFVGFGQKGVKAEAVAKDVVNQVRAYQVANVPVGVHLANQLLLPLAIAGAGRFRTMPPTQHTRTNAEVIAMFLDVDILIEEEDGEGRTYSVRVRGRA